MPNQNIKSKFQNKVLGVLLFVAAMPVLIISFNSIMTTISTRQQNVAELQNLAIETTSEKLEKFFKDQKINLVISTNEDNLAKLNPTDIDSLIDTIIKSDPYIKEITAIDKNGWELRRQPRDRDLRSVIGENYFITAIRGEKFFGSVNYTDIEITMDLAAPIRNQNNELIGVVYAKINLSPIEELIKNVKLGKKGFVYVLDEQGGLISSSNEFYIAPGKNFSDAPNIKSVMGGAAHDGMKGEDKYYNGKGEKVIFAGRALKLKSGEVIAKWSVISEWPEADAFEVINTILYRSTGIIIFSILLAVVISIFLTAKILKPIKVLSTSTEEVSKGNLEHKVVLPTGDEFELLGEHFNVMIDALKENARLKEEFVFIAAHELRTPVTAIKGYLSMLIEGMFGEMNPKAMESIKIANSANDRLVQLVQDLLEVARSDAGKMKIEMKPVNIQTAVHNIVMQLKTLADKRGVTFVYKEWPTAINVLADDVKLNEVLVNIIGNAIKYTVDNDSVEIYHEEKDGYLITHIRDHGIGMTEEERKNLFAKFYRIQNEKTKKIEGTGLGLFICKEIINRMQGEIWATSEQGKGSVFSFSLKISA